MSILRSLVSQTPLFSFSFVDLMVRLLAGGPANPSEKVGTGEGGVFAHAAPKADAIVVLSGMLRVVSSGDRIFYELSDAADRLFAEIDLIEPQKAPLSILARGQLPWSKGAAEGEVVAGLAMKYGFDPKQIRLTISTECSRR